MERISLILVEKVEEALLFWLGYSLLAHSKAAIVELLPTVVSHAPSTEGRRVVLWRIVEFSRHRPLHSHLLFVLHLLLIVQVVHLLEAGEVSELATDSLLF